MLEFPQSTYFNKRIPKQKFYEHLDINNALVKLFVSEVDTIIWKNKLSQETLNINPGTYVTEIEVIEINLKQETISKQIIESIDKGIPYQIVFIIRKKDFAQLWISYKENSKNSTSKSKIEQYYKTDWISFEEITLKIEGLNLDKVYENFMSQISLGKLQVTPGQDIKEAVQMNKDIQKLEKQVQSLQKKINNEKQFNKQIEMDIELKKLKTQLQNLQQKGDTPHG
jgi:predicted RNase H-like nuclease (RuvC/YqgF family)